MPCIKIRLPSAEALATLRLHEPLLNVAPIEDGPNGVEIGWTRILVLQIIGMLPDVDAEQGSQAGGGLEWVLICGCGKLEMACARIPSLQ